MLSEKLKTFKKEYYQWRYWNNIINTMQKHKRKILNNSSKLQPYINKPGIAFSFDDSFRVDHWYKYGKELFGYYEVKVTFNINAFHFFEGQREHTQNEIDMLIDLQSNGHEIAHHGFKHKNAANYSTEFGLKKWVEDEVVSLINWAKSQSHSLTKERLKQPVSFALPFSELKEENVNEVFPKYYKVIRGGLNKDNLTPFNHSGFAPSICIDSVYLSNAKYINKIMDMAKKMGCNLIFMCHSILPEDVAWKDFGWEQDTNGAGWWRITPNMIKALIEEAKKKNMEFYTTAEISGVATFIDRNFERCVRDKLSKPSSQWISIEELCSIKELDLSNKNISSLDGLQYFLNLEKLNLSNNNITDLRLIDKLQNIKEINVTNNPICIKSYKEFIS